MTESPTTKKVLIVYASFGAGHRVVAENIAALLQQTSPRVEIELLDVLSHEDGVLSRFMKRVHYFLYHHAPVLWGVVYEARWARVFVKQFRYIAARFNHQKTLAVCYRFAPDIVISTQTTATGVLAYLRRHHMTNAKLVIVFTDFGFQPLWLYNEVDEYWTVTEEQCEAVRMLQPAARVERTGVVLKPVVAVNEKSIREQFGIPDAAYVVLWSSGSLGVGWSPTKWRSIIERAVQLDASAHHIIVCGHNNVLRETLQALKLPRVTILGFYSPMSDLYAIADTFVTKAGGVSVAEALQYNLRVVLSYAFPGQEQANYDYLVNAGLAAGMVGLEPWAIAAEVVKPSSLLQQNTPKSLESRSEVGRALQRLLA